MKTKDSIQEQQPARLVLNGVELPIIKGRKDVFISYNRKDADFVARLSSELQEHGINAWFDLNELHQDVGEDYIERIHKEIDNSEHFLLIYTKEVEVSDFVINEELKYAFSKGKTILFHPLESFDNNNTRLSPFIGRMKRIGNIQKTNRPSWEQGIDTIIPEGQTIIIIRMWLQYLLGRLTVLGNYRKLLGNSAFYNKNDFQLYVINKSFILSVPEKYKKTLKTLNFFRKDIVLEVDKFLDKIKPDNIELKQQLARFIIDHKDHYPLLVIYDKLSEYLKQDKYKDIELTTSDDFGIEEFITTVSEMVACTFITDLESGKTVFNQLELGVYNIIDSRTTNSESSNVDMQLYYSDFFTYKCMTTIYQILDSIDKSAFDVVNIREINLLAPFLCSIGLGGFFVAGTNGDSLLLWKRIMDNISSTEIWHFPYDETISLLCDGIKDDKGQVIIDKDNSVHLDIACILNRAIKESVGATISDFEQDSYGIFEIGLIRSERLEIEIISRAFIKTDSKESPMRRIRKWFDNTGMGFQELSQLQLLPLNDDDLLLGKMLSSESYSIFKRIQQILRDDECWHKNEIFISYSRHDSSVVHPFVNTIQNKLKTRCWIDLKGIESGDQFEDVIIEAIERSKIVLFMLSDNSLNSNWTKKEVYYAEGEKKKIVPIVIDNMGLRGWFRFHFGNIDYIDSNSPEQVSKLIQNLNDWLKL